MKTRLDKRLKQPTKYEGGIPQYSLGGILSSTASGASFGSIVPIPGASLIGGGVGLVTGLFKHFRDKKEERAEKRANAALGQASGAVQASAGGSFNNFTDMWTAGKGGIVNGGNKVKLRNKEMVIGNNGSTVTSEQLGINTPYHTNENIVSLEDGSVIISPENTKQAKLIAKRQKPEIDKLNKVISNKKSTPLARRSAERRIEALKREYTPLIIEDAKNRINSGLGMYGGEIPEAGLGWISTALKGVGNFLKSDAGKNVLGGVASLAPVLFNIGKGLQKPEHMDPTLFQNPMAYDALATLRNRQPDISPALRSIDTGTSVAESNLRSSSTGRGQYMSGRIALANAGLTGKSNVYSQASQERNRMLGEYSQMQAGIGQKMADTNLIIEDLNARNRAAQRGYASAAVGQLGQWAQNQQLMGNQRRRDDMMMGYYKEWFDMMKSGGTQNKVATPPISPIPFIGSGSFDEYGNWVNQ